MKDGKYVYRYIDLNQEVIYVGKTINLHNRFQQHKSEDMYKECYKVEYIELENPADMEIYETYYINKYNPKYNKAKVYSDKPSFYIPEQEWKVYFINTKNDVRHSTEVKFYEEIFKEINKVKFNNELPMVIILFSSKSEDGNFENNYITKRQNGDMQYTFNLYEEFPCRELKDNIISLFHNMIHLYCAINGIKDSSNRMMYHNKFFAKIAKEHGGIVDTCQYGFQIIDIDEELNNIVKKFNNQYLKVDRFYKNKSYTKANIKQIVSNTSSLKIRKKSSTRKYICPCCGNSFRATKDLNVMCMDCNVQYIKENVVYVEV